MKFTAAVLLALVAVATASYFDIPENRAREKKVNTVNAQKQISVNYYAEKLGASSGTAKRDGVPGTPLGVTGKGYGYYPAAHGAYYPAAHGAYYPAAHGANYPAAHGAYYQAAHDAHYPAAHGAHYPAAHGANYPAAHAAHYPAAHGAYYPAAHGAYYQAAQY